MFSHVNQRAGNFAAFQALFGTGLGALSLNVTSEIYLC